MTDRWLRHSDDGFIYGYTEDLAKHPKLREVTALEAFPEQYMPPEASARITKGRAKPAKVETKVVPEKPLMDTEEILASMKALEEPARVGLDLGILSSDEPEFGNPDLDAEAARGL